jgi:pentatricopeptide repeat protein
LRVKPGIEPNVITFSSLMTSCGNGGSWQIALQLIEALESRPSGPWERVAI